MKLFFTCRQAALAAALSAGLAVPALAQSKPPAPPAPPAPAPAVPAPSGPTRTTASFSDWTLRCERPPGAPQLCEIALVVSSQGQPVAQVAIGRTTKGEPLHLTMLVPSNVTLSQAPRLGGPGKDAPAIDLAWRRCLPVGCFADATVADDVLKQLRNRTEATKVAFLDGGGRDAALPFSSNGLGPALDALTKDEGQ